MHTINAQLQKQRLKVHIDTVSLQAQHARCHTRPNFSEYGSIYCKRIKITANHKHMSIFLKANSALDHIFQACTTAQINEFVPVKRGFRIHGHSTTLRLEAAFWSVLEEMARDEDISLSALIEKIHDTCLVANDKNLASCLRVICLKYLNLYA